jgi:hypothetical protein
MEESDLINSGINVEGDPSHKISEIKKVIKDLEKQVDAIQSDCNHSESEIKNCPTQSKTFCLKKICKVCQKELGYPSQEEIERWAKI